MHDDPAPPDSPIPSPPDPSREAAPDHSKPPTPHDFSAVDDLMGTDMDEPNRLLRELIRQHQENKAAGRPTGWEKE